MSSTDVSVTKGFYCPVCEMPAEAFLPAGTPQRQNVRCPSCGSLERHRLDWIFLRTRTNLFDGNPKKMLHVAPEPCFQSRLSRVESLNYVSIDRDDRRAMLRMDLLDLDFRDGVFGAIYCSHVLEHIVDDAKAIGELYRVCKPGGWAVLQVPINAAKTFEDPSITEPEGRRKAFGSERHVRCCGPDYIERMAAAGFDTRMFHTTDIISLEDSARMGIQSNRTIFFCVRPVRSKN